MISSAWALQAFMMPTHFIGSAALSASVAPAALAKAGGTMVSSLLLRGILDLGQMFKQRAILHHDAEQNLGGVPVDTFSASDHISQ